ncbi:MAG: heavy-metal-associated domain-containing protein [Cyanobacteriota bacterium]|nr:heavy-metal-associated domain-containing protein [Cyanobacteriota bacterium]
MSVQFKVPSIACDGCAETITKAIVALDPDAKVDVDVANKTAKVEAKPSEAEIKDAIVSAGHTVEQ